MVSHAELLFSLLVLLLVGRTAAQGSNVTLCIPQYAWSINSRDQTPCYVAAFLENVCTPTESIHVDAIPVNNHYTGPSFADANPCRCNVVVYSLISACGGCQDRQFISWENWTLNCPFTNDTYPRPIPKQVEVPSWAYLDISLTNDTFNATVAEAFAMSNASLPTPTSPLPEATSSLVTLQASTTTQAQPSDSGSSVNAGAIAGGVVGGIAGIAALFLLAFWFFLRSNSYWKRKRRNSQRINLTEDDAQPVTSDVAATTGHIITHSMSTMPTEPLSPHGHSYMETHHTGEPLSPITSAMHTTPTGRNSMETVPYAGSLFARGGYTGAAIV